MAFADLLSLNSSQVLSKLVIELKCLQLLPGVDIGNQNFFVVVVITAFTKNSIFQKEVSHILVEERCFQTKPNAQITTSIIEDKSWLEKFLTPLQAFLLSCLSLSVVF